jgi:hypothetical protein
MVMICLILYSRMPPSVAIWKMSRYHATMLPAVLLLTTVGTWDVLERLRWTKESPKRRLIGGIGLAALGCALWAPALVALPMDWQRGHEAAVELGQQYPELWRDNIRIVTPDNRRRFLDLSPRTDAAALTRGRQEARMAIPIAYAARYLRTDENHSEAYYFRSLYCYLAVLPDEAINPQCAAMEKIFEMKEIASVVVDEEPYLLAYAKTRIKGPLTLTLFSIGNRKLDPDAAMALIPEPLGVDSAGKVPGYPIGAATNPFMDAPQPGVGASLAPAFKKVPW